MSECFRCGSTVDLERFGNAFICPACIPDGNTVGSDTADSNASPDHENPIDVLDVSEEERAEMLREYLSRFVDEFGQVPRLMPLDDDGKAPIIQGRARLDSPEGRSFLVDGEEAIRQLREDGVCGFAIYAGKQDHGTEDVVFVDHDDDAFPSPTSEPTLEVLSGSGRGTHETYRNAGDVRNARVGDNYGEIRAENWYVVTPGSVHPSGGVYHLLEDRDIATLADNELDDSMRPAAARSDRDQDAPTAADLGETGEMPTDETIQERLEKAFANSHDGERIKQVYNGRYRTAGFDDRSAAEFWLANRLDSWVAHGNERLVRSLMDRANLQKWPERPDESYRRSVLSQVGRQDWYYDPDGQGVEHRALLPPVTAWDWREAGQRAAGYESEDGIDLSVDDVRERTVDEIADATSRGHDALIEVLPTGGKSYGAIAAAAKGDTPPVTILTTRGRKEQYDQLAEWCDEHGLTYKIAPSFFEECETAAGHHGDEWQERVADWYRRGATGQDIHKYAEDILGRPLPCQCDERSGEHIECSYTSAWRFDPAENPDTGEPYDVVIGHYIHAHNPKILQGRAAIFDEFTDGAYEHALGHGIEGAVSYFLKSRDDIPFDEYTDLIANRDDEQRRADALLALAETGLERDGRSVLESDAANASAPLATFTLLAAAKNNLGNGWERAAFPDTDDRVGLHNRKTGEVRILAPPELDSARAVVALDGTPTPELWNLTLGARLSHRPVLDDDERPAYIRDALELSIVRTTEYLKPYNSADHVNVERDIALLEQITDSHGEAPGVISTRTALQEYENADALAFNRESGDVLEGPAESVRWYGNVLGSNQFKHKRVGAVIGSNHYGDGFIKKWAAYAGETADRNDEKGGTLSYGAFGDKVLTHMREHDTLQAAMRFGRDGKGATVYVHTDTLPDWVPTAGEGRVIRTRSDGERQVLDAIDGQRYWTTREIADHPDVQVTERRVHQILDDFVDRGYVTKGQSTDDGRAIEWADAGLEELPDHVELPELGTDVDAESCGNERSNTIYTWISATSSGSPPTASVGSTDSAVATDGGVSIGGDPPTR